MPSHTVACRDRDFVEWHGGRSHAVAWALELDHPDLRRTLAAARAALEGYLLRGYLRQPHVTLAYAGLVGPGGDEYGTARLDADLALLRRLAAGPVKLRATGWGSFPMVPYLELADDWLPHAHGVLTHGAPEEHEMAYVPHVTVGHYGGRWPMAEPLGLLREVPAVGDWVVPEISLVRFRTARIAGPLDVVGRLDLATGAWTLINAGWLQPGR
ncbi:2'-5' RNA ligase family protein [Tessaracoccus rhinocerotis]|uniref:2'-5' RNA ligase family protein n=1 Tax=Tessaracoccus rhinocerotis TaxID=1689449 RepID=UPI00163DCDD1|nr:2'-5' RNA ligase family protein [Tessaracoccus rhinocerotis]